MAAEKTVFFYYKVSEKDELEVTVHFVEKCAGTVIPKCADCGHTLDEQPLKKIGRVIKVVDTTDTTNTPVGEEQQIDGRNKHFKGIIAEAQNVFHRSQKYPDIDDSMCGVCTRKEFASFEKQSSAWDRDELEESTVYKPRE